MIRVRRDGDVARRFRRAGRRGRGGIGARDAIARLVVVALVSTMVVGLGPQPASADEADAPTLWVTDAGRGWVYHLTLDGDIIGQPFRPPRTEVNGRRATSSVAVDPTDLTLWGAVEGTSTSSDQGRLVNYTRTGEIIQVIEASGFAAFGTEGIDVTVATNDNTLWVVDDPIEPGAVPTVFNVTRSGDLISSFPTTSFDPGSVSPQAIAFDPFTESLWLTDNRAERVYNVATDGTLLSSFSAADKLGTFNIQGISVESSQVLWVTERDADRILRVTKSGDVLLSLDMSEIDPQTDRPEEERRWDLTGVAFDRPPGYLGAAAGYTVLALAGAELKLKGLDAMTGVVGDVGLGPGAEQNFDSGLLTGTYFVDPTADNAESHSVIVSGGVEVRDLALAASDAAFSSLAASVLKPTQVFGEIKQDTTIAGEPGANIIDIAKLDLDDGERLTLTGSSSRFVINIATKLELNHGSSIVLEDGLTPDDVFINIVGSDDSSIEAGSRAVGTIVAPAAKLTIKGDGSTVVGSVVSGRKLELDDGGRLRDASASLGVGDLGEAASGAVLALPGSKVKLRDAGSVVVGDVLLGPGSEQDFGSGEIQGALLVDPAADNTRSNSVLVTGGVVARSTSPAVADAIDASNTAALLEPDLSFTEIKDSTALEAVGPVTVVAATKVELDDGEILEIRGDASSIFVINVEKAVKLKNGSAVVLSGGVAAANVIFNIRGSEDTTVEAGSRLSGTVLAPRADKLKVKEAGSTVQGAIIGGGELIIEKSGAVGRFS